MNKGSDMYAQVEKPKEHQSKAAASSVAQKKSNVKQGFGIVDNRPETVAQRRLKKMAYKPPRTKLSGAIQSNSYSKDQKATETAQCVLVAQLATRQSSPVQFQGGMENLRDLILQWNYLPGIQVVVQPTDFVGGTYTVRFTRDNGVISLQQANEWVQNALNHAPQNESSSDESSSGDAFIEHDCAIVLGDGTMTSGRVVSAMGDGLFWVRIQDTNTQIPARRNVGGWYEFAAE
ncbi:hypothetical protein Sden_3139 [Shewanella denitrificans OS217]|uniref:Uncharacterized protein n=2 Tax=Shewanella TaxID=22 RepID=Q12JG1_SHEDO|nr:hypothetical protein Sden_3139 [Shewanella denitrificans OS217]